MSGWEVCGGISVVLPLFRHARPGSELLNSDTHGHGPRDAQISRCGPPNWLYVNWNGKLLRNHDGGQPLKSGLFIRRILWKCGLITDKFSSAIFKERNKLFNNNLN